tara:strand:- start:1292 stop:1510 length:219 start_codon:yes stop_codon:yes gene_type:complete
MKDDGLDKAITKLSQNIHSHIASNCGQIGDEILVALRKETFPDGKPRKHLPECYSNLIKACCRVLIEYRKIS